MTVQCEPAGTGFQLLRTIDGAQHQGIATVSKPVCSNGNVPLVQDVFTLSGECLKSLGRSVVTRFTCQVMSEYHVNGNK